MTEVNRLLKKEKKRKEEERETSVVTIFFKHLVGLPLNFNNHRTQCFSSVGSWQNSDNNQQHTSAYAHE
jgi:hypothetical protein